MGAQIIEQERDLARGLTIQERDAVLQYVGDASLGHNTPFQAVWNVRNLGTRMGGLPEADICFKKDGTLLYGRDSLDIATLG